MFLQLTVTATEILTEKSHSVNNRKKTKLKKNKNFEIDNLAVTLHTFYIRNYQ